MISKKHGKNRAFCFWYVIERFSSLHCSLPYIQSWGMLLQRGCIYKLEFYHCKIILGGNDRQQYNCNNNQCCSLIKSLLKSGILVLETALGLALWLSHGSVNKKMVNLWINYALKSVQSGQVYVYCRLAVLDQLLDRFTCWCGRLDGWMTDRNQGRYIQSIVKTK